MLHLNENVNIKYIVEKLGGWKCLESKPKKRRFEVEANENISDCIDRMEREGYTPVRRMEEPVFQEVIKNGKKDVEYLEQRIIFEGKLK
jgi:hypothetical protein